MGAFSGSWAHVTLEAQEDATFNTTYRPSNREHGPYHAGREVWNTRQVTYASSQLHMWRVLPQGKSATLWRGKEISFLKAAGKKKGY